MFYNQINTSSYSSLVVIIICLFGFFPEAIASVDKDACVKTCKEFCTENCETTCANKCMAKQKEFDSKTPFEKRAYHERKIRQAPFVLIPYKPNYVLASWDDTLDEQDEANEPYETKFQVSFKIPVSPADREWTLYFGYTQLSVWQMANTGHSSPFRDTNYEPELMLYYVPEQAFFGSGRVRLINFGIFNHQSNGQSGNKSRSWNRSYIETVLEYSSNHYLGLKLWHRWEEKEKSSPDEPEGDDNRDIDEFIGHGEIKYLYAGDDINFGIIARDNFHHNRNSYGSYQVDLTFPLGIFKKESLKGYLQFFDGYGETLIDYNHRRRRVGIGVILADWL